MSKRALTIPVVAAFAAAGVATAGIAAAQQGPADASQTAPTVTKPTSQIVSGYLAPGNLQAAIDAGWQAKVEAYYAAVRVAMQEEAARQAAAAEAARQAAAAQAAAAQAAATQSYSAPAASVSTGGGYAAGGDVSSWANSGKSMSVKQCESGNNYSTNTGNGYYGAWQFDLPSWHANGGGAYASRPDLAPAWAQDQVAYNYYQNAGWGPWSCG